MGRRLLLACAAGVGAAGMAVTKAMQSGAADTADEAPGDTPVRREIRGRMREIRALARSFMRAIHQQVSDPEMESYPPARAIVTDIEAALERHARVLDEELASDGEQRQRFVARMAAAAAAAAANAGAHIRSPGVPAMLRDDYTALNRLCIEYTALHAVASAFGREGVAAIAERHLHDLTPFVTATCQAIPAVVVEELSRDGLPVELGAAEATLAASHHAWHRCASASSA